MTWGGRDFAGISESGIETLKSELNSYANKVNDTIAEFNAQADLTATFAGDSLIGSVQSALEEGKAALAELVTKLKDAERDAAQYALEQWGSGTGGVAGTVDGTAAELRSSAATFTLD